MAITTAFVCNQCGGVIVDDKDSVIFKATKLTGNPDQPIRDEKFIICAQCMTSCTLRDIRVALDIV